MVAVVVDQVLENGTIALVRSTDGGVLGHVRELRAGVWHGAIAGEPAHIFRNRAAAERYVLTAPPSAWTRALERAIAEGVDPIAVVGLEATYLCESTSRPGIGYLTDEHGCTCPAGQQNRPCKHTAAVRHCLGLPVDPGTPRAPEPPAGCCPVCDGSGWTGDEDSGPVRCAACVPAVPVPALCPYCGGRPVNGANICRPCLGTGRGDMLTPASLAAIA